MVTEEQGLHQSSSALLPGDLCTDPTSFLCVCSTVYVSMWM